MSNEAAAAETQNNAAQAGTTGANSQGATGGTGATGAATASAAEGASKPDTSAGAQGDKGSKPDSKAEGKQDADKSLLDQAKAEGEKKEAEGEKKTDKPGEKPSVPEKYDLKPPDGMTLDQAALDKFTPLAKELGLSNEAAQKLINLQADVIKAQREAQDQSFRDFVKNTRADTLKFYQEQEKSGGASMKEEMVYVAKGRDAFASPELIELFNASGLSDHKAVIAMFAKLGRQISEDKHVEGSKKTNAGVTAKDLYSGMNP